MAIDHVEKTAASPRYAKFRRPERAIARSYEGTVTKFRLQEALAREDALRRQIDELIQQQHAVSDKLCAGRSGVPLRVASLSPRQRQIMELVLAGHPSKNIVADLGISQRTVENHRASIMKKLGTRSVPELARLALAAAWNGDPGRGR